MAANEPSLCLPEHLQLPIERIDSEYECDLMIEALSRELTAVRDHLAFLTHHLHADTQGEPPSQPTTSLGTQQTVSPKPTRTKRKVHEINSGSEARRRVHYLGVVDRLEEERALARKQCLQLMKSHIEEQLVTLQKRSEIFRRKLARRQGRIRAAKLKLKPPRFRSSGVDDTSFLSNVYISTFYQIVGEEHRLRKAGKLKTLTDFKQFWDSMLSPLVQRDPTPRPHPHNDVDEDEDFTNSWALTALPPDTQSKTPVSRTPCLFDKEVLEFVPSVPPKLRSVADILDEGKQLREKASMLQCPLSEVSKRRRQTQRLYQQAKANEIAMRRLLPPSPTFDFSPFPPSPVSVQPTENRIYREQAGAESVSHPVEHTLQPAALSPSSVSTSRPSNQLSASVDLHTPLTKITPSPLTVELHPRLTQAPMLIPLTMDYALQEGKVIEPKCKSTLWTNFITVKR